MISQPMAGKTKEMIADERKQMVELLKSKYNDDFEIMDTTVPDYDTKTDLECFSESIGFMAEADVLVMSIDWEKARGCKLEHEIGKQYGVKVIYLDSNPFIYGLDYSRPACCDCPNLQYGDICVLEKANEIINDQRKMLKQESREKKQLKKEDELFFGKVFDILLKYQNLFNREMADEVLEELGIELTRWFE